MYEFWYDYIKKKYGDMAKLCYMDTDSLIMNIKTKDYSLNVKLSNSQLNKLKSSIKNETDVVLRISSNMVGSQNDNTNFPHELLLTNRQVANICKAFAKNTSTDIKLSKTQLSKMIQSGGFLGNLLGKLAGPLMKVAMPLAKNVLAPLGLTAAMSAVDRSIRKKMLGSGATKGAGKTTLIFHMMKWMIF